jgi:DNA polymerase III delta subunit
VKPAEVRKQIESGETAPLYLLEGDDLQSRHELAMAFAALVDEGLQAFNVQSFYANEATSAGARDQMMGEIVAAARTLPMMAPRRVLLVHDADKLLAPRKAKDDEHAMVEAPVSKRGRKTATPSDELEAYFQRPEPLTTLVFAAEPLDRNRRLVKVLQKHAVLVTCGTLADAAEATRWIKARLEQEGLTIEPRAVTALLQSTGLSLGHIRLAIEKLALYAAGEKAITVQHVRDTMTPADEPGEGPAVAFAIRDGNVKQALHEVTVLLDSGAPHLPILGQIRWGAGLLRPERRARQALSLVLETDLALKSSAGEPRYLIEKLVIDLCTH